MEYLRAISILEIDTTKDIESQLKSKYRQLMKKYHPDNVGDNKDLKDKSIEIGEAYKLLRDFIEKDKLKSQLDKLLNSRSIENRIITMSELCAILNSSKDRVMNKSDLSYYNIFVITNLDLFINNEWIDVTDYFKYNNNGYNRLNFDIEVDDMSEKVNIGIRLIDKEYMTTVTYKSIEFNIIYNGIRLSLNFNKKLRQSK